MSKLLTKLLNGEVVFNRKKFEKLTADEQIELAVKYYDYIKNTFIPPSSGRISANYSFQTLWRSIYGDNSWEANPWVWVYEFKIL